jgi:hypothetical protein
MCTNGLNRLHMHLYIMIRILTYVDCLLILVRIFEVRIFRIFIYLFIYPQIAIQQYFYDSLGSVITIYPLLIRHMLARYKYIRIIHHVGRLFAHRGLDDLDACW